ncbi:hypothetical protein PG991_002938 [Apiospora marii]|uniref:Mid2 domain-containing protein n=1 Tax=Apiospora marii TaxID=335849 RepID=A0ABR1SGT1_9PEZI
MKMGNNIMTISLLSLGMSLSLFKAAAADSKSCFKRDGTLQQEKTWLPCSPEARVSHCCREGDFCMSNGLCLNAIGNQYFSAQGCTNSKFEGCNEICNATIRSVNGYGRVWFCSDADIAGSVKYCCGPNADCCKQPDLHSIIIATAVFRPPGAAAASTSASDSTGGPMEPANDSNNNDKSGSSENSHALAIGLGVGIPMGLALLGGIIFLGLQLRKWTAAAQQARAPTADGSGIISQNVKERDVSTIPSQQQRQQPYVYPSELNSHEPQELVGVSRGVAN